MDFFSIIIIVILILGAVLTVLGIMMSKYQCPKERIIYRYIPRTFEEEQNNPVYVTDIFKTMFSQQSPWIVSINNMNNKNYAEINKFFLSQV